MHEIPDIELLRQYLQEDSEEAFAALVTRHVNTVYSAALRKTGNPAAAEEITQAVFVILAKKANALSGYTALSGWLYQTARLTAANFLRTEIHRARREQEAYMESLLNETEPELWLQIKPLLEDAMGKLAESDRNALALRFFERKSFQEIGAAFGATENAAKKRVAYALEKLRKYFSKHGVTSTTEAISGAISANSIQAAPATLVKAATAVALAKGATASTSTLTLIKGALKLMAWTKIQTTVLVGAVILTAATTTLTVKTIQSHRHSNIEDITSRTSPFRDRAKFLSPFTMVHFDANDSNKVIVAYDGTQYQLAAINDVSATDILNFCRSTYGQQPYGEGWAEKRFAEDLPTVLSQMGHPADSDTISLTLIDPQTGEQKTVDRAQMTGENRGAIVQDRILVNSNLLASLKTLK
jgi:RNA polymerase sigma factor (sigma-70 family)